MENPYKVVFLLANVWKKNFFVFVVFVVFVCLFVCFCLFFPRENG